MLKQNYDDVANLLQQNDDGTYKADLSYIRQLIDEKNIEFTEEIEQLFADSIQNAISQVQSLASNGTKGYTSLSEMQKMVKERK